MDESAALGSRRKRLRVSGGWARRGVCSRNFGSPLSFKPYGSRSSRGGAARGLFIAVFALGARFGLGVEWVGVISAGAVDHHAPLGAQLSFSAVSCPSVSFCVAVESGGRVVRSSNPSGDALSTSDPVGGAGGWRVRNLRQGYNTISGLSCPTVSLCVGYDNAGNILASKHPGARQSAWSVFHLDAQGVSSLSCVRASFCFGLDGAGNVLTSSDPAGAAHGHGRSLAWTPPTRPRPSRARGVVVRCGREQRKCRDLHGPDGRRQRVDGRPRRHRERS